ncbi:MAG: oligosaccharide flippase family protein [Sphingobium sp.]
MAFYGLTLVIGRIMLSVARMVAALCVARLSGAESFGAYALLLSLIGLFEWLVDFGQTDMAVRDGARRPHRRAATLHALMRAKRVQGVAGAVALPLLLIGAGQGRDVVLAGCAGGIAVLATALAQPARVSLRLAMRMDRDIGAELAGLAVMLPLLALAGVVGASLPVLIATWACARVVQAALTVRWAGPLPRGRARPGAAWRLVRGASPLGVAGLLVVLYDALAPLLLARLMDLHAVALFAAATRFIFPVLVAVQAINAAFLPILAGHWRRDPAAMARAQQAALLLSVGFAALLFAGIHGGAAFLMGLMGPDFVRGAGLLQIMAWALLARAVTTAMAPLIIVAGRHARAMLLTVASLGAQVAALLMLVPRLGVTGAGVGYVLVELILGTGAVSWTAQTVTGVAIDWRPVLLVLAIAASAALTVGMTPVGGGFTGGIAAGLLALAMMLALAWLARRHVAPVWSELRRQRLAAGAAR